MLPVLFSIGGLSVSSFGVFLALGFLLGIFLIWRLARAWDLDEEKVLDLTLLTFLGGLLGARVYFAIGNWQLFASSPLNFILINKMPGFSFWGGFLGGWLTLYFFAGRKRLNFWQIADIAMVGLLGGLVLADLGCFLGGCNIGIPAKTFFAVSMAGFLGKRWPIQAVEALLLIIVLLKIWSQATHFHQRGKIAGLGLVLIGSIKFILEPLKQNRSGAIFEALFIILGMVILYRVTNINPLIYLKKSLTLQNISKYWYNQKASIDWKLKNLKKFLRRLNVKFS